MDEAQAGIKIARRNINSIRYADDTTLMAESEEELKSLETKVKESESEFAQSCLTLCNPKGMSLLFNMLSRLVIPFLPRSKHLLISWLQSPSPVIWSTRK